MNTPGISLQGMTNSLLKLRSSASFLEDHSSFDASLQTLIRKFRVSSTLSDRYAIAITGSESAGKTTFLRKLYDLDTTWLQDNQGRGEKVPLLVIEKAGIDAPEGWIEELQDKDGDPFKVGERQLEPKEFHESLKNWGDKQLLSILYVPPRYFNGARAGFLLLPGYAMQNHLNADWQDLMRHALIASSSCIIVSDKTHLAAASQQKIIDDLRKQYLEGAKPIIVISKTENLQPEKLDELIDTAAKVFDIDAAERDRVICIGSGDADYLAAWRARVVPAIERYSLISSASRKRQMQYLDGVLQTEVGTLLGLVRASMNQEEYTDAPALRDKNMLLEEFDLGVDKLRIDYKKALKLKLDEHAGVAAGNARKRYQGEEEGPIRWIENRKRWLTTTVSEREDMHSQRIQDCWKQARSDHSGFGKTHTQLLTGITQAALKIQGVANPGTQAGEQIALLGYGDDQPEQSSSGVLTVEVQNGIRSLFHSERDDAKELEPNEKKELRRAIAAVPALALEFARITELSLDTENHRFDLAVRPTGDLAKSFSAAGQTFGGLAGTHSSILKSIGVILAVDVAVDGTLDTIPSLFNAIGGVLAPASMIVPPGPIAALGGATVMAAAGLAVVAFAAYSVANEISRIDAANLSYIQTATGAIRDAQFKCYSGSFDDLMGTMRSTLEARLMVRYRLDEHVGSRDGLMRALANVKTLRTDLLESIRENPALA